MDAKTGADIDVLKQLLVEQQAEIARLLEKVSRLEDMVSRGGVPGVQLQAHPVPPVKPVPRRWRVKTSS